MCVCVLLLLEQKKKKKLRNTTLDPVKKRLNFDRLLEVFPPAFHRWFQDTFSEPARWLDSRVAFIRSCAAWSMVKKICRSLFFLLPSPLSPRPAAAFFIAAKNPFKFSASAFFCLSPPPSSFFRTRIKKKNKKVGSVVGLGDRHGENLLLDRTTGECVHVNIYIPVYIYTVYITLYASSDFQQQVVH